MESVNNVEIQNAPKETLYCGKYKSPEDLEKGYLESQKYIETLREQIKSKESILAEYSPPEDYKLPETLPEVKANYLKSLAKNAQLTQKQIDNIASSIIESDVKTVEFYENKKKELGEDYNKIKNYAELNYPNNKTLQEVIINTAINDKEAMVELLNKRESMLNTSLPQGTPTTSGDTTETLRDEYRKLYDQFYITQDSKIQKKLLEIGDRIYLLDNKHA